MMHSAPDLERFLSAFYAVSDAPFITGTDTIVTLSCCRTVLVEICAPEEPSTAEIVERLRLPESFVRVVLKGMDLRNLRSSPNWSQLIEASKSFSSAPLALDEALDRLVDEFWMRDVPKFQAVAQAWQEQQAATVPNRWWTDAETRPVDRDGTGTTRPSGFCPSPMTWARVGSGLDMVVRHSIVIQPW